MRPRRSVRPWLINLKMKHCPGCAIDVSYMRWQIQAIPCVPSVIISFSPGRILSEYLLTTSNVHCWRKRERERAGASQADCSYGRPSMDSFHPRFILVNRPSLLWLADLMAHKHTWLHKGGETDWWNNNVAPGECNFSHKVVKQSSSKHHKQSYSSWRTLHWYW